MKFAYLRLLGVAIVFTFINSCGGNSDPSGSGTIATPTE